MSFSRPSRRLSLSAGALLAAAALTAAGSGGLLPDYGGAAHATTGREQVAAGEASTAAEEVVTSSSTTVGAWTAREGVSVGATGRPGGGDGAIGGPSMSEDGNRIVFTSAIDRAIVRGVPAGCPQVYLRDRALGTTSLITTGKQGGYLRSCGAGEAAISGNGRTVVFTARAAELSPTGEGDARRYVFFRNLATGSTRPLALPIPAGFKAPVPLDTALSRDARYLTVRSNNDDGFNWIHMYDRQEGRWQTVCGPAQACRLAGVDPNGRYVAYGYLARDHTGPNPQHGYLFDRQSGRSHKLPLSPAGPLGLAAHGAFSGDGSTYVLLNERNDIVRGYVSVYRTRDRTLLETLPQPKGTIFGGARALDQTGRRIALEMLDPARATHAQAYLYDRQTDTYAMVSRNAAGHPANGPTLPYAVTPDGAQVLIESPASNLVAGDVPYNPDTYDADLYMATRR